MAVEDLERNGIAETLEQARARTLALLEGLSEEQLSRLLPLSVE
jgi:hypothetical protein